MRPGELGEFALIARLQSRLRHAAATRYLRHR